MQRMLLTTTTNRGFQKLEVVRIKKEFRGQGYGKSVLHEICGYSRNVIHLHQIYAIVGCDNARCLKLLKSFGFQGDICLKDWIFSGKEYGDAYFLQKIL